jgi:hypothetical protein
MAPHGATGETSNAMTINPSLFVPAVFLLLVPADRLLSSLVELRSFDGFQSLEDSPRHRPWWWVPALWLDPFRGFFGAMLLRQSLALPLRPSEQTPVAAYGLALVVLALGCVGQTFTRRGDRGVLLAPMGYIAGVVCALTPWSVAIIANATATLGLFALRQFHAFFAFGLVAVGLLGFALGADVVWIVPAIGAFALPLVAGFVTGSTLELPTRNASEPGPVSRSSV